MTSKTPRISRTSRRTTTSRTTSSGYSSTPARPTKLRYFERDDMTLEQAQMAKIDLALGKLGLTPGMTLLDIGCGWGAAMRRAVETHDVNVIGLTLSKNQATHVEHLTRRHGHRTLAPRAAAGLATVRRSRRPDRLHRRVRTLRPRPLPGLLPHGLRRPPTRRCHAASHHLRYRNRSSRGTRYTADVRIGQVRQIHHDQISPAVGCHPSRWFTSTPLRRGFPVTRVQSLQPHYATTLDHWAEALRTHRDEAIAIQSVEVYDRYMKYLTGCADMFRLRQVDVNQFTLQK
ncbi:cyclopropane mycolic acid synthase family methyltransferase [Mycolicibacterium aubagnense]